MTTGRTKSLSEQETESEIKDLVKEVEVEAKKRTRPKIIKGNVHTGSDLINLVLGGGFPYGIVNIVGDSSSGKSFLSGEFIAMATHSLNGEVDWFYDDVEKGYRFNTKKLYNLDILNGGFYKQEKRSHTIEDFEIKLRTIIEKKDPNRPFIYVLDSFDALTSRDEIKFRKKKAVESKKESAGEDTSNETGSYNLSKQKENHAIFRTLVREIEENKIILIVVSQVKEKIGVMFGAKYYRTGGKSLDFYPNVVFWLSEVERYMKRDRPIGICVKVLGTKTRNDKPFRSCFVDLLFDYGVDNISSNLKFLYDLKTKLGKDTKDSKNKIKWEGEEYIFDDLVAYIEQNNLETELLNRTIEHWDEIERSISNDHRKRKW